MGNTTHLNVVLALQGALGNVDRVSLLGLRRIHLQVLPLQRVLRQGLAVLVHRGRQGLCFTLCL